MANGKSKSAPNKSNNDDRRCKKAWKKHPGVAPKAHNGHSIGGYSIKKHGAERAAELADMKTTPMAARRMARRALRHRKAA